MLGGLLRLADDELDRLVSRVLDNPRVQRCIEGVVNAIVDEVIEHLLKELAHRLDGAKSRE